MIRFQREWMAFNEVAGFLYSPHCCEELTIEGVVVALRRGQCLGVESHWQPAFVGASFLDEGSSNVDDELDLTCCARML